MPAVRLLIFECYALLTSFIAYNSEIMSPYSCYVKKGLVYIVIADLSNYQPSSYSKCTKSNIYALYNVRSVSLNKCIFFTYFTNL